MVQSVLMSEQRLFRCQRQTYRTVHGHLYSAGVKAYWHRYKARELKMSQLLGRCAHLTGPA